MKLSLDFASREYIFARKLYISLGAAALACLAALALTYVMCQRLTARSESLGMELVKREAALRLSEKRLAGYARDVDAGMASATYAEAAFANSAIRRRTFSWTQFLNRFEVLVPEGVGITGIKPNFQTLDIDLSGTAKDMDVLTEFIRRLTGSRYFSDIPPSFKTTDSKVEVGRAETLQVFNLKIRYIPEPGAEGPGEGGPALEEGAGAPAGDEDAAAEEPGAAEGEED